MPYATKEAKAANAKLYRQTTAYKEDNRNRQRTNKAKPFIGVDGEGGNINGRHEYLLLRVGEHLLYNDSKPLSTNQILTWLVNLPREGIYVGYGFDYDVTMILADWPPAKLAELFDRDSRISRDGKTLNPVGYKGFLVEYLPRKHFRVARWTYGDAPRTWFTVHDTIGFYQCSFVQALEAWQIGTPGERAAIKAMKDRRSDFSEATADEIEYNRRECVMLAELTEALRDAGKDAGYTIRNYEGAGCLAQAMLVKHEAPLRPVLPEHVEMFARAAYYGGRFEISRIGIVAGVHEYDLASAYPWAMTQLPCLEHGEWVHEYQKGNPWQLLKVEWATGADRAWGPYPFRDSDGTILYPARGSGWYWGPEVQVEDAWNECNTVLDAWSFVRYCDHKPFSWIPAVFAERQRIGKGAKGKILKLGLNSLYGKQAQSVGAPRYANPVYAGLITSIVRGIMADVCRKYSESVVMIATDGIYLTEPMRPVRDRRTIEAGDTATLGCWEHREFSDLFLFKPGIYFTSDGTKVKTRGVPRFQLDQKRAEIIKAWDRDNMNGSVTVSRTQFIGARHANHLGRPDMHGQWVERSVTLAYESNQNKRCFDNSGRSVLWSREGRLSTPYRKAFGSELQTESLWEDLDVLEQE